MFQLFSESSTDGSSQRRKKKKKTRLTLGLSLLLSLFTNSETVLRPVDPIRSFHQRFMDFFPIPFSKREDEKTFFLATIFVFFYSPNEEIGAVLKWSNIFIQVTIFPSKNKNGSGISATTDRRRLRLTNSTELNSLGTLLYRTVSSAT